MKIVSRMLRHTLAAGLLLAPVMVWAQGPVSTAHLTGPSPGGTIDLEWNVSVSGGSFFDAFVLPRGGGVAGDYGWIGASASGTLEGGVADGNLTRFSYAYETTFIGSTATGATFQCAVDDGIVSVILNGSLVSSDGCDLYSFGPTDRTLAGFNAGLNTLRFNTTGNGVTDGLLVHISSISNDVTATPEPASIVLLATGLAGVFGAVRRKRSASSAS